MVVVVVDERPSSSCDKITITSLSNLTTGQSQMDQDECKSAQQLPLTEDSG